jgi:hypothetical protein
MGSYTAVEDADEPVRKGCAKFLVVCGCADPCLRSYDARALWPGADSRRAYASDGCVDLLVGGEPQEPIDAAPASPLELVLASVF